jgi:hypothetical protein
MTAIWWEPKVVDLPSLDMGRSSRGGYMKPSWGQIGFAPDTYTGEPPRKATVELEWGLTYAASFKLFDGTIILRRLTNEELIYDIFETEYETQLLEEGTDTEDEDVDLPLVIGNVEYMQPQRTGDKSEQRYYLPDFAGSIGDGIDAYDDGVLINDNWTDNGDGTVSRSVDLVGTLYMSGTGNNETLVDMFSWACDELGLTLNSELAEDVNIDTVISSQQYTIDFLDKLAWYADHGFYILDDVLYLVHNDASNGVQQVGLEGNTFDPVKIQYNWPQPIKKYTAEWQTRDSVTDSDGTRVEAENHDIEVFSDYSVIGVEESMPKVYNYDKDTIKKRVEDILERANRPQIEIDLPLYRLPRYGEKIEFVDEISVNPVEGYVRVREFTLDYSAKTVTVKGDGEVNFI